MNAKEIQWTEDFEKKLRAKLEDEYEKSLIALLIIMNVIDYVLYDIERFLRRIIK